MGSILPSAAVNSTATLQKLYNNFSLVTNYSKIPIRQVIPSVRPSLHAGIFNKTFVAFCYKIYCTILYILCILHLKYTGFNKMWEVLYGTYSWQWGSIRKTEYNCIIPLLKIFFVNG